MILFQFRILFSFAGQSCRLLAHLWFHQFEFNDIRVESNTYCPSKNCAVFFACVVVAVVARLSSRCYHFIIRAKNNKNKSLMLSFKYWFYVPLNWCSCCCCFLFVHQGDVHWHTVQWCESEFESESESESKPQSEYQQKKNDVDGKNRRAGHLNEHGHSVSINGEPHVVSCIRFYWCSFTWWSIKWDFRRQKKKKELERISLDINNNNNDDTDDTFESQPIKIGKFYWNCIKILMDFIRRFIIDAQAHVHVSLPRCRMT